MQRIASSTMLKAFILPMAASVANAQQPLPIDGGAWDDPIVIQDSVLSNHKEISAAVVLPNEAGHVLFWAQVDCNNQSTIDTPSAWVWRALNPTQAAHKPAPGSGAAMQKPSLKGTGMAHLPNGDILAAGATEQYTSCMGTLEGSDYAWIWDTQNDAWAPGILTMSVPHYYPTVLLDQTGIPVVIGHDNLPAPPQRTRQLRAVHRSRLDDDLEPPGGPGQLRFAFGLHRQSVPTGSPPGH